MGRTLDNSTSQAFYRAHAHASALDEHSENQLSQQAYLGVHLHLQIQ